MENVKEFMADVVRKNPGEFEFHQAVQEVAESIAAKIGISEVVSEVHPEEKFKVIQELQNKGLVVVFFAGWFFINFNRHPPAAVFPLCLIHCICSWMQSFKKNQ